MQLTNQKESDSTFNGESNSQFITLPLISDRFSKELAFFTESLSRFDDCLSKIKLRPLDEISPIKGGADEPTFVGIMDESLNSLSRKTRLLSELVSFLEKLV